MFDRKTLKTRAKLVLSRSYFMSILACIIVSFVGGGIAIGSNFGVNLNTLEESIHTDKFTSFHLMASALIIGLIVLFSIAFSTFLTAPLRVGLKGFMLRSADGDTRLENLLSPFKTAYKNVVWVAFVKNLYVTLWSLLGLIPIAAGVYFFDLHEKIIYLLKEQSPSFSSIMSLMALVYGTLILTIIFSIPAIIKKLQYSMVDYLLAENPHMKRHDAISKSKEMMVGNKWAYVKLIFSFVPWYIAANLMCCIGSLLLEPYIQQTYAQMYLEISGQGKDYSAFDGIGGKPFGGFGM